MFEKTPEFYDAIYSFKPYDEESDKVHAWIQELNPEAKTLLDVGCGTGSHLTYLSQWYQSDGLDLDEGLLSIARSKLPDVTFHHGDMIDFDIKKMFDVIVCLFGAIAYTVTEENLQKTLITMSKHLNPGGILVVEGFLLPEQAGGRNIRMGTAETDEIVVARVSRSEIQGKAFILDFHYLVGQNDVVNYLTERHKLALFTVEEYQQAFTGAGFSFRHEPEGVMGRSVYIGTKG